MATSYSKPLTQQASAAFDTQQRKQPIIRHLVTYLREHTDLILAARERDNSAQLRLDLHQMAARFAAEHFSIPFDEALRLTSKKTGSSALGIVQAELHFGKQYLDSYLMRKRVGVKSRMAGAMRKEPTKSEVLLLVALRRRWGSIKFDTQKVLCGYIADIFCERLRLIIEVDGGIHALRSEHDQRRDAVFMGHGVKTVRVSASMVENDIEQALEVIAPHIPKKVRKYRGPLMPGEKPLQKRRPHHRQKGR